jgi:hypothetical protein
MEILEVRDDESLPLPGGQPAEIIDLEVVAVELPAQQLRQPLPMPDGKPIPCFFGRRFLNRRDLIQIGIVPNDMTLRRLIAEGRFPPPLELGRRLRLWDVLELQALVDRLAAARDQKEPAAHHDQTAGDNPSDANPAAVAAAHTEPKGGSDVAPS